MVGKIRAGEKARIIDLSNLDALVRKRLLDLGITEGSVFSLKNMMPFGGPLMLESYGQCVGIRRKDAIRIEVEKL